MKIVPSPTDVEKTFLELIGFNSPDAWTEFCQQNPDESRMMASHFNIAMKVAVAKCHEIIAWRKLNIKKYNDNCKKRKFRSILDKPKSIPEDPQIITKLEFIPKKSPTESISTVSTITPEKTIGQAFILETKTIETQTQEWPYNNMNWYKEKHDLYNTIKKLEKEKAQLSNLNINYYNTIQLSNKNMDMLHSRFLNLQIMLKNTIEMYFKPNVIKNY